MAVLQFTMTYSDVASYEEDKSPSVKCSESWLRMHEK